jgi:hypothetical protein
MFLQTTTKIASLLCSTLDQEPGFYNVAVENSHLGYYCSIAGFGSCARKEPNHLDGTIKLQS